MEAFRPEGIHLPPFSLPTNDLSVRIPNGTTHVITQLDLEASKKQGVTVIRQMEIAKTVDNLSQVLKEGTFGKVENNSTFAFGNRAISELKAAGIEDLSSAIFIDVDNNTLLLDNVTIRQMTDDEFIELRNALNQLLIAIIAQRQKEEDSSGKLNNQSQQTQGQGEEYQARPQMKPSDYLIAIKDNIAMQMLVEESRREERKREEQAQKKDDDAARIKEDVIRTDYLKRGILKSQLDAELKPPHDTEVGAKSRNKRAA